MFFFLFFFTIKLINAICPGALYQQVTGWLSSIWFHVKLRTLQHRCKPKSSSCGKPVSVKRIIWMFLSNTNWPNSQQILKSDTAFSLHSPHSTHVGSPSNSFHYGKSIIRITPSKEDFTKGVSVEQDGIVQVSSLRTNLCVIVNRWVKVEKKMK